MFFFEVDFYAEYLFKTSMDMGRYSNIDLCFLRSIHFQSRHRVSHLFFELLTCFGFLSTYALVLFPRPLNEHFKYFLKTVRVIYIKFGTVILHPNMLLRAQWHQRRNDWDLKNIPKFSPKMTI